MYPEHMAEHMGWGLGMGWIFMVFWWILIVSGILALIKFLRNQPESILHKTALNILEERYARGEINQAEFAEKKQDLVSR